MTAPTVTAAVRAAMLEIKCLDPDACIELSVYTQQWFVSASVDISDGRMLTGVTEHRNTPDEAVLAFHDRLCSITLDERIAAAPTGERRHYRWNGAAFAEVSGFRSGGAS